MIQQPLSILHVIASLAPRYGGPAKVAELCAALSARGHSVQVLSTNVDGPDELDLPTGVALSRDGFTSTVFRVRPPRATAFSPGLALWLRKHAGEFDVAHVHGLYVFPTLVASHYCRRQRVPYVFQPHGGLNAYHRNHHRGRKALYELLFERRNVKGAATIRYDSVKERGEAVAAGFAAGVVVPPGAKVPPSIKPEQSRRDRILFLGRLTEKKGVEILLEAFAMIATELPDAELRIAGPDGEGIGARLAARALELGLSARVRIEGLVLGAEKERMLAGAAVVVLPSADESFGASVIEGMANAAPVVLTHAVPIHSEIAASGAGIVVDRAPEPLAEALRTLLADPDRAAAMGRNGRVLVEELYSWEAVAGGIESVYVDVIAASQTRESRVLFANSIQRETGGG